MHSVAVFLFISALIFHASTVPAPGGSLSSSSTSTAIASSTTSAFTAAAPKTAGNSCAAIPHFPRNRPAYRDSSRIVHPILPIASNIRGRPFPEFIDTSSLSFFVIQDRDALGFKVASPLFNIILEAYSKDPTVIVGDTYISREEVGFPSMYIDMFNDDCPLRWGDLGDFGKALLQLLKGLNEGRVPTSGGRGFLYYGDIYPKGLLEHHLEQDLVVGHFHIANPEPVIFPAHNGSGVI